MEDIPVQKQSDEINRTVKTEHVALLVGALFLGFLFNYLFFDKSPGISCPIFVIAFYAVLLLCMRKTIVFRLNMAWALSIPILMLSLTYFLYSNIIFNILNFLVIPLLIIVQTVLITGNNTYAWYLPGFLVDILFGLFYRTVAYIAKPFKIVAGLFPKRDEKAGTRVLRRIVLGLLISVPLLLVVISLLVSADQIFESYLNRIPNIFAGINVEEYIVQAFLILFIFFVSFSYMISLYNRKKADSLLPGDGRLTLPKVWDPVVVITILVIVNAIYFLFVFVQFAYLFGGAQFDLPQNFTYSAYARRGFFELITVTLINFGILMIFIGFTRIAGGLVKKLVGVLYSLLVGCTMVMLFSAYYRMLLYEEAYGFTYLRVLTQSFMVFLLILFVIMLLRIWNDRISLAKPYIVTALAAFVIINYINVDVVIARNNVDRYNRTNQVDVAYLNRLSYDAVPEVAKLAGCKDEKIAVEVGKYLKDKKAELSKDEPWQSFNISRYRAGKAVK